MDKVLQKVLFYLAAFSLVKEQGHHLKARLGMKMRQGMEADAGGCRLEE
jgi:hypothetical protein